MKFTQMILISKLKKKSKYNNIYRFKHWQDFKLKQNKLKHYHCWNDYTDNTNEETANINLTETIFK